jgi:N-acetylmuramoyl-L-alanine amidase-like protein
MARTPGLDTRIRPNVVLRENVINQSDRTAGVPLNLIVLHSTESHNRPGDSDLAGVAGWFDNPAAQASSHVIVDADGSSARCVPDDRKAWTCEAYNSASLNIEQIGFASQGRKGWRRNWRELRETARWIARWSRQHRIPIRRAHVANGVVTRSGVTTHAKLGSAGGGHHDPGDYPFRRVLLLARLYKLALS